MVNVLRIGAIEILALADGAGIVPGAGAAPWARFRGAYPEMFRGEYDWHIHNGCYLVRSEGRTILVDTGMGPWPYKRYGGVRGRLMEELKAAGVGLAEVDTVFMTHAHPDHVGWNVLEDGSATFPQARYMLNAKDWEWFVKRETIPNYVQRSLLPLESAGALDLFDGEPLLTAEVRTVATPGHTPGHMALLLNSQRERAVFTGDIFSNQAYVTDPDMDFGGDSHVEEGRATRRAMLERIEAEGLTVIAGHMPEPGFGQVVWVEGKRYWRGL
jgi:glyoxylase-like metal-dependent hydrolase (beta-lactamase superfamily II)